MDDGGIAGKVRTLLMGMAADRDDIVKMDIAQIVRMFRPMLRNINAAFGHGANRKVEQSGGRNTGGIGLKTI